MAGKRVLIVDDDPDIAAQLRVFLSQEGFEVCGVVERATAAVNEYDRLKPDLILLDINMPGSDGFMALKRITARARAGGPKPKVIMISARDSVDDIDHALEHGAADYLTKPLDKPELVRKLRKVLNY